MNDNSLVFQHYLIDTQEYVFSKVIIDENANVKYVKMQDKSDNQIESENSLLQEISSGIEICKSANEMVRKYLNLFFNNRKHIIKALNIEDKSSDFKVFKNSVFDDIILKACKELINNEVKAVTFEYMGYKIYNYDDECIDLKFYYALENEKSFTYAQILKLFIDEELKEIKLEIGEEI
jgi:hypothetical protein